MNDHLNLLFLITILISILPFISSISCPSSKCSNSGPTVRFPFRLHKPNYTSPTGYINLSCNPDQELDNATTLNIPYSGDFYVREIDYYHQQVMLYDPQNCTPNRLMKLNLSNSPFDIDYYYRNYTFLSCPAHLVPSHYTIVDCLSNSTTSVLATYSISLVKYMVSSTSCNVVAIVSLPISWPYLYDQTGFASDLNQDFRLGWNITGCVACERNGGFCQVNYSAQHERQLGCLENCQTGQSQDEIRIFKLFVLGFTIPALAFTVCVAMYFWYQDQKRQHQQWEQTHAARTMHQPTLTPNGLDELTIESYAKIVVGDSKRIPGPNDIACPICLADYCPKDTLRSIPECLHCFHAECIDEWLRSNPTCPVCRNSPPHA